MEYMVWIGAAMAGLGLVGLAACIAIAVRARRAQLRGVEMRDRLRRVVALNTAALMLSALGLGLVIIGILLG